MSTKRKRGRPTIPLNERTIGVNVALTPGLIERVDQSAIQSDESRSAAVRRLLSKGLAAERIRRDKRS